jgi:tetratricopeptide (TPR) repeat protein
VTRIGSGIDTDYSMALKFLSFFRRSGRRRVESIAIHEMYRHAQELQRCGDLSQARTAYASILKLDPDHWGSLTACASILLQEGDYERALELYDGAVLRTPENADAHYKRANVLNALSRWEAALSDYDLATELDSNHANAYCNRGVALEQLQRLDEALASYNRSAALNPTDFLSFYNRASVLRKLGRIREALNDYEQAISLKSDYAEAYVNRGNVLQELLENEAALASYDRAIELQPVFAEAFQGRASSLFNLGRFDAAITDFDQALKLQADQKFVLGMRRFAKMMMCDWSDLAKDVSELTQGLRAGKAMSAPFPVLSIIDSTSLQKLAAQIWVREQCPGSNALPNIPARAADGRIRIGYFSADFRIHAVAQLAVQVFETHDRSKFETTAFSFGPLADDAMHARLGTTFDRFMDVTGKTDMEVVLLARDLGIDIAVDLGGFTQHARTKISP